VIDKEVEECAGKCQGGGICMNGECRCRKGTSGAYCQYRDNDGPGFIIMFLYFAVFTLVAALIAGLFYGAYVYLKKIVRQLSCQKMIRKQKESI
jgi:hypothetical protein